MRQEVKRRAAALAVCVGAASCVTPASLLDRLDNTGDQEVADSVRDLSAIVADRGEKASLRCTAAKVLGRLGRPSPQAVSALARALADGRAHPDVRRWSAWALGELRAPASLQALVNALRRKMDGKTGAYVLEALAKHDALLGGIDDRRAVEIVEALVAFRTGQGGAVPPIYDVVSGRLKTIAVLVKILDGAVQACASGKAKRARCRDAAFELLEAIDLRTEVIATAGDQWRTRLEASMGALDRAVDIGDPSLMRSILAYLGRLAAVDAIAERAAVALVGTAEALDPRRPSTATDPSVQLVATWALTRLIQHSSGPRRALAIDAFTASADPRILALLADVERRGGAADMLQRILGVEVR